MIAARAITIRGIVQGVGFRPFVYRTAHRLGVRGWVLNDAAGVRIHAEADPATLDVFIDALRSDRPPAAIIASLDAAPAETLGTPGFDILGSDGGSRPTVRVSPDLCLCEDCLRELRDPTDRRHQYEYINCTNCGPRFSIITALPYDRTKTTMAPWSMCPDCNAEYHDPADRRFHAQPAACPRCGPRYELRTIDQIIALANDAINRAARMLAEGAILAVKGIGGYHLACDARRPESVALLRERKYRKDKPFAILAADIEQARSLCDLSQPHESQLLSPARPIVLAPARVTLAGVAPGIGELGIMLPSTPLQHLLIDAGAPTPMVLTSANRSSEPICYREDDALDRLRGIADAFLIGERPIARRVDDSVVAVRAGKPRVIRRARGLAPAVVATLPTDEPILALGSDLKNAIALVVGGEVLLSQHIGDLGDAETDRAFRETIDDLLKMYDVDPARLTIVHDLHPGFVSTAHARTLPCRRRRAVQHHAAHAAAVLAEHALLNEPAVVLALDGTGFAGSDEHPEIWGGEVLLGSVRDGFVRVDHLRTAPMPGGDAAARWPAQAAAGRLHAIEGLPNLAAPPFRLPARFAHATRMIDAGLRCFPSSSVGRLFDAAAALLGFDAEVTYEGQAAIWLEQLARRSTREDRWPHQGLDDRPILRQLIHERLNNRDPADTARAFHNTLATAFAQSAIAHAHAANIPRVACTGGVFQNTLLSNLIETHLTNAGLQALSHQTTPTNDGGIALGQAAMAACASH